MSELWVTPKADVTHEELLVVVAASVVAVIRERDEDAKVRANIK